MKSNGVEKPADKENFTSTGITRHGEVEENEVVTSYLIEAGVVGLLS